MICERFPDKLEFYYRGTTLSESYIVFGDRVNCGQLEKISLLLFWNLEDLIFACILLVFDNQTCLRTKNAHFENL